LITGNLPLEARLGCIRSAQCSFAKKSLYRLIKYSQHVIHMPIAEAAQILNEARRC